MRPPAAAAPAARPRRRAAAIAVGQLAIASCVAATRAEANSAAPFHRDPYAAGGAFLAEQTSLVVDHETLAIDCDAAGSRRECTFVAVYEVSNPTEIAEEVLGVFFGASPDRIAITVDGVDVRHAVSSAQIAEALRALPEEPGRTEEVHPEVRDATTAGFVVRVEAGARRSVRFAGSLEPTYRYQQRDGYAIPAIHARHPFVGGSPHAEELLEYTYFISPIRTWRGEPSIDVTVRAPASWAFTPSARSSESAPSVPNAQGWTTARDGAHAVSHLVTTASRTPRLSYTLTVPAQVLVNGGPVGGIGAELEEAGPRFRAGYEVGIKDWMIASLAYETFVDRRRSNYAFVPAIEAASPNVLFIIPSLSAGLGVPVELHSSGAPRVGARGFVGMSFPLLSLLVPIDVYFDDPSHPRAAFMGQLSF